MIVIGEVFKNSSDHPPHFFLKEMRGNFLSPGCPLTNTLEHWEKKLRYRDMTPLKIKAKWVGIRALTVNDIVALANTVDDLVAPYNPEKEREKKKKYVTKGDCKKQKKKHLNCSNDYDLSL